MKFDSALVWFRRDLRNYDHAALQQALASARRVFCCFIFDAGILGALEDRADRRVEFIRDSLVELDDALAVQGRRAGGLGGGLVVEYGDPRVLLPAMATRLGVDAVFANRDYEPDAKGRDAAVAETLAQSGIAFHSCKDQAVLDGDEVLTLAGQPFSVFTPYKRAWLRSLRPEHLEPRSTDRYADRLAVPDARQPLPALSDLGFRGSDLAALGVVPGMRGARQRLEAFLARIDRYADWRDFPASDATSRLSVHLRFGTVSVRELCAIAWHRWEHGSSVGAGVWLGELIWRDFFFMILDHHPRVTHGAYRPVFDRIQWDDRPGHWAAWCEGRTGYPLVDAAMRQLNSTGFMHNRLRMVVASFLTKDLGIDWRRGERYFASRLLDYDLAANNGGWQWAASTGCDAQPYFRIFSPVAQSMKFDPGGEFIRRHCPELYRVPLPRLHAPWTMSVAERAMAGLPGSADSLPPIVDHSLARVRALARYKAVLE